MNHSAPSCSSPGRSLGPLLISLLVCGVMQVFGAGAPAAEPTPAEPLVINYLLAPSDHRVRLDSVANYSADLAVIQAALTPVRRGTGQAMRITVEVGDGGAPVVLLMNPFNLWIERSNDAVIANHGQYPGGFQQAEQTYGGLAAVWASIRALGGIGANPLTVAAAKGVVVIAEALRFMKVRNGIISAMQEKEWKLLPGDLAWNPGPNTLVPLLPPPVVEIAEPKLRDDHPTPTEPVLPPDASTESEGTTAIMHLIRAIKLIRPEMTQSSLEYFWNRAAN